MDKDLDKVIDSLLRNTPPTAGRAFDSHPDADEIAAFAERAVGESKRSTLTMHFSECDRCRNILGGVIALKEETEQVDTVAAVEPAVTQTVTPWYAGLLRSPGLAFGLAALVLTFGLFIGYTALVQMNGEVATVANTNANLGGDESMRASSPDLAAISNANAAANAALANTNASSSPTEPFASNSVPERDFARLAGEGKSDSTLDQRDRDEELAADDRQEAPAAANEVFAAREDEKATAKERSVQTDAARPAAAGAPPPSTGISARQAEQLPPPPAKTRSQSSELRSLETAKRKTAEDEETRREVGGKSFVRRSGVWYDSEYRNQRTTNVRRGTEQFRQLAKPVRDVADTLPGTIVILWQKRAYRID